MTYDGYSVIALTAERNGVAGGDVVQQDVADEAGARQLAVAMLNTCVMVEIYGPDDELVWTSN